MVGAEGEPITAMLPHFLVVRICEMRMDVAHISGIVSDTQADKSKLASKLVLYDIMC